MSTQTMLADVIDALYDLFAADSTLSGLGVIVRDGDEPSDRTAFRELWVGGTGMDDDDTEAATSVREWAHASAQSDIDEWVSVTCASWYWSGETNGRATRRASVDQFNAVALIVRNTTLGLARVLWCEIPDTALRQIQDKQGTGAGFVFTVRVRCRIEPN